MQNLIQQAAATAAFPWLKRDGCFFGGFAYGDGPVGAYFTLGVRLKM